MAEKTLEEQINELSILSAEVDTHLSPGTQPTDHHPTWTKLVGSILPQIFSRLRLLEPIVKDINLIWFGNSHIAATDGKGNIVQYAVTTLDADPSIPQAIHYSNDGVNGLDTGRIHQYFDTGFQIGQPFGSGQTKSPKQRLQDGLANGWQNIFILGENFNNGWTNERLAQGVTPAVMQQQLELVVDDVFAVDPTAIFITCTPAAVNDYWNATNGTPLYNRRPDYYQFQEETRILIVSRAGVKNYLVADLAADTHNQAIVPDQSMDGTHLAGGAGPVVDTNIGPNWVSTIKKGITNTPQIGPKLATTLVPLPFSELVGMTLNEYVWQAANNDFFTQFGRPSRKTKVGVDAWITLRYNAATNKGIIAGYSSKAENISVFGDIDIALWITEPDPQNPNKALNYFGGVTSGNALLDDSNNLIILQDGYSYALVKLASGIYQVWKSADGKTNWQLLVSNVATRINKVIPGYDQVQYAGLFINKAGQAERVFYKGMVPIVSV